MNDMDKLSAGRSAQQARSVKPGLRQTQRSTADKLRIPARVFRFLLTDQYETIYSSMSFD